MKYGIVEKYLRLVGARTEKGEETQGQWFEELAKNVKVMPLISSFLWSSLSYPAGVGSNSLDRLIAALQSNNLFLSNNS